MRFLHLSDYGRCAFGGDPKTIRTTLSRVALSAKAQRSKLAIAPLKRSQKRDKIALLVGRQAHPEATVVKIHGSEQVLCKTVVIRSNAQP